MDDQTTIRPATIGDVQALVQLRRLMFESMGYHDTALLDASDAASQAYFEQAIPAGQFHGWLAITDDDTAVGSGGVVIDRHPPGPSNLTGETAYVMNVVTAHTHRRQGIARRIMQTILDWSGKEGIHLVTLHASDMGRPLYLKMGFENSSYMRLYLK